MQTKPLFDDQPVTEQDVQTWLNTIPRLSESQFRREAYRRAYRVEEKIRHAKQTGNWPPHSQHRARTE